MINLTIKDKEIIRHLSSPKVVSLSCGDFLVKSVNGFEVPNELIGKKLADIFGLKCPKYFLVDIDGQHYYLSEDLKSEGEFLNAGEVVHIASKYSFHDIYLNNTNLDTKIKPGLYGNSLYDVWAYFDSVYDVKTSLRLMFDMLKIYIFDLMFGNYDRRPDNWGILNPNSNEPRIVIFDNESLFNSPNHVALFTDATAATENLISLEVPKFLSESSSEFKDLFKYYYDLMTPDYLASILNEVDEEYGTNLIARDVIMERFIKRREELLKLYNSYEEGKNAR